MDEEEKVRTILMTMQEKKNVRKLISLIVLLTCTVALYYFQQGESQALVDPSLFKVDDPAKIDRVVLELKERKVDLHFDGTRWKVNSFEADRALIDVLFAALAQAIPKRPVAVVQRDSVNGLLNSQGVTVSLFEGSEIRKQFAAGGDPQKRETYFRIDKNSDAFLMTIPGYRVYLAEIFSMDENGWRDKRIFDFAWRNFRSLTTNFPAEAPAGFVISRPDMSLTVTVAGMNEPDTSRVNAYLDDVLQLAADRIISRGTSKRYDSLAQTPPVTTIEVSDIANRTYRLELFPQLPPTTRDPSSGQAGETLILGTAHDGDLVLFDRRKLFRVVKKRSYFEQKRGK